MKRELIEESCKESSEDEETIKKKSLEEKKVGLQKMKSGNINNHLTFH